jgi:hypothetical protein
MELVNFPIGSQYRVLDSGATKVFLVALNPNREGNISINLEGTFSGDDVTLHKSLEISNELLIEQIPNLLREQDIQDSFYFPCLGISEQPKSIPFVSVLHLGTFDMTIEYLKYICPWTCGFYDLTDSGRDIYLTWKKNYPDCEIRLLTMANI